MTNSSKNNKLFLCFRPVVDLDVMLDSPVSSHNDGIHNSLPPKRKFSRLIKAMVFESLLNRRSRRKNRSRRDSFESDGSYSTTYTDETSSTGDDRSICSQSSVDVSVIQEMNNDSQLSLSSSSPDSKLLMKSKSCPSETKPRKRNRRGPLERKRIMLNCSGIYLLLLSLILTVFLGKILGIVLTSICLYSLSLFKKRYLRQKTEKKDIKNRNRQRGMEELIKGIKYDGELKQ